MQKNRLTDYRNVLAFGDYHGSAERGRHAKASALLIFPALARSYFAKIPEGFVAETESLNNAASGRRSRFSRHEAAACFK